MAFQNILKNFSSSLFGIVNAPGKDELAQAVGEVTDQLGLKSFNISINIRQHEEFVFNPTLTNWSKEDVRLYVDSGCMEIDPLLRHIKETNTPLVWERESIRTPETEKLVGILQSLDVHGGIVMPLPARRGNVSGASFIQSGPSALRSDVLYSATRLTAELTMQRLDVLDGLSDKQIEILRWVSLGKSNADIATILDLPRKQVDYHVSAILKKLGVSTRIQAAAIYAAQ